MIENSAEWWEEQARAYALSASNLEEELRAFRADSRIKADTIERLEAENKRLGGLLCDEHGLLWEELFLNTEAWMKKYRDERDEARAVAVELMHFAKAVRRRYGKKKVTGNNGTKGHETHALLWMAYQAIRPSVRRIIES